MEVSGQYLRLVSITPRETTPVPTEQKVGWTPESAWTFWRTVKFLVPTQTVHSVAYALYRLSVLDWQKQKNTSASRRSIAVFDAAKFGTDSSYHTRHKKVRNQTSLQCTLSCKVRRNWNRLTAQCHFKWNKTSTTNEESVMKISRKKKKTQNSLLHMGVRGGTVGWGTALKA
jgi:hypothetical protein